MDVTFEVSLFSVFWLAVTVLGLYEALKKDKDDEEQDLFDNLMELERFVSSSAISKTMLIFYFILFAIDVTGFYFAYDFAYAAVGDIYYRILFFIACFCVFIVEQSIGIRYILRASSAIRKLDGKPNVLHRWISMNEPHQKMLSNLAALTKFTIALQLFLFTFVSSF